MHISLIDFVERKSLSPEMLSQLRNIAISNLDKGLSPVEMESDWRMYKDSDMPTHADYVLVVSFLMKEVREVRSGEKY